MPLLMIHLVLPPVIAEMCNQDKTGRLERTLRSYSTLYGVPSLLFLTVFMLLGGQILGASLRRLLQERCGDTDTPERREGRGFLLRLLWAGAPDDGPSQADAASQQADPPALYSLAAPLRLHPGAADPGRPCRDRDHLRTLDLAALSVCQRPTGGSVQMWGVVVGDLSATSRSPRSSGRSSKSSRRGTDPPV